MASIYDEQRGRLCTVCYHQFSCHGNAVPRILMCGHSFCTGCLSRLLGQLAHGHIRCPTCKGDTLVPGLSNDINKLSKNFGVLEILESMEDGSRGANGAAIPFPLCSDHDDEPMKVFCIQDDHLICIYCQVYGAHQGHQCQLVTILAEESRKTIRSYIERLSIQKDSMVAVSQAVNDATGAVQIKENRLMYEMTQHFELLRRKLYQRENQVKIMLQNRTSAKVMLLDKQKRKLRELISKVDQLSTSCQSVLTGPDYELVQQKTKLENDFQSLSSSIEDRDLRPCTRDDLHCHLDPSMVVQVSGHGMLVKEPVYRPLSTDFVATQSAASTSTASRPTRQDADVQEFLTLGATAVVESVGSGGDADRWEGDGEPQWLAELPPGMEVTDRNNRQQSSQSDVIVIYDDMDLETAASSSNSNNLPAAAAATATAAACQANTQHTHHGAAGSPSRQSHTMGNLTQKRPRKKLSAGQFLGRLCAPDQAQEYPDTNQDVSSSSDEDDCPDLSVSELSDMELERPLRSAWANRGGWSTTVVGTGTLPASRDDTTSVLVEGASGSVVGDVPSGVGTADADGDDVALEEGEEAAIVVHSGGDRVQTGEVEERRDEGNSWEVSASLSPRRGRRQGHSSSQHQRFKGSLKCSVFNCTSTNCSFYVRCKNCGRLFCQKCVNTSISARRCYKRPRGHSFIYIPVNPDNASAVLNNNQVLQRLHHLMHYGNIQRGGCLRQHDRQPRSRLGLAELRTLAVSDSWHCIHCWMENWQQSGSRQCVSCGQVNESPQEVDHEIELMTFPPSPEDSVPSSSGAVDRAQEAEARQENPTSATANQEAEITQENLDLV
ncbi:uncharacterized protein LOC119728174 [Patiria miniata]|uniref:Uncharacterized protein n=1 Tax=Patiria miniata TaxID=46514 RepID=A0A913ZXZ3_PATMI|nr:uncharacterized protein LOC119728174 [Patiria miniata]